MSGMWPRFPLPPEKQPKALIDAEMAKLTTIKAWERRARERGESLADLVGDAPWLHSER